ncbi:hypothetical protein [Zoogloea sp.]|nr:hypothetical protein [Zoogloea sp.]
MKVSERIADWLANHGIEQGPTGVNPNPEQTLIAKSKKPHSEPNF